ncbi:MAG: 30S ribosomal protein S6e [Candidatus Thermoplasmatota archaeon]
MVEFKAVIADPKTGLTYKTEIKGHFANSLIGKKIGEEFDGIFVGLPGYKLKITGGSDKSGFPMRRDLTGARKARLLVSKSIGFNTNEKGLRRKKSMHGNTVSADIVQLNVKIIGYGPKKIDELFKQEKVHEGTKSTRS